MTGPRPVAPRRAVMLFRSAVAAACDYDPEAAQECLDVDWICGISGYPEVVPPLACEDVCG